MLLPCQQLEEFLLHPQNHQRSFMHHFLQPQAPFVIFLLSSQMFSPQMDLQQLLPSKEYAITFKLSLALQCLANLRVWTKKSLRLIADFTSCLDGSSVFSKLDLQKGYYQVPMSASDIQKNAIISPFGMFEFLRLSFSLRNAGQMFQRIMDHIFGDVPFCFVYVDDILAFSKNPCFSPMRSF